MKTTRRLIMTMAIFTCSAMTWAQVPYPKSFFEDTYAEQMTLKGKTPGIGDFATFYFESDAMPEIWGLAYDAWRHYQKHEPQAKGSYFVYDAKNGYLRYELNTREAYGDEFDYEDGSTIEMCYWNCADRRHKLFAINCKSMDNGRYYEAQYEGIFFQIYDNNTRKLYVVSKEDIGAEVPIDTDEGYTMQDGKYYVKDRKTGQPLTLTEEEFSRWSEDRPVVVYSLPQQGKDITVLIQRGANTEKRILHWDGMRFSLK